MDHPDTMRAMMLAMELAPKELIDEFGDMAQAAAMLMNQATALQSLFTHLTERGLAQSLMPDIEGFMRMARAELKRDVAELKTG